MKTDKTEQQATPVNDGEATGKPIVQSGNIDGGIEKVCDHCNNPFLLTMLYDANKVGVCLHHNCPHCGQNNDVWIKTYPAQTFTVEDMKERCMEFARYMNDKSIYNIDVLGEKSLSQYYDQWLNDNYPNTK